MNALVIYIVKAAAYTIAFYTVYALLLSRDTLYARNRSFILASLSAAMVLPLFTLHTLRPLDIQYFGKILEEVLISGQRQGLNGADAEVSGQVPGQLPGTVYAAGVIVLLTRLAINLGGIVYLISRHRQNSSRIVRFRGTGSAGFSAMGYIFINSRLAEAEAETVIRHEQNHLNNKHFLDILFLETIKALQWFNPAIHLFDRSLRAVHEFQADEGCISSGIPVPRYQSLLLQQVFGSHGISLANSFSNPSLVRRRMIMMTKRRTRSAARLKSLFVLPVAAIVFLAISAYRDAAEPVMTVPAGAENKYRLKTEGEKIQMLPAPADRGAAERKQPALIASSGTRVQGNPVEMPPPPPPPVPVPDNENQGSSIEGRESGNITDPNVYVVVEEMPRFPGGDGALLKFIAENTVYPAAAKEQNIQGRVIVRFAVTETGAIDRASILKGVSPDLDAEAIRVVSQLPAFSPGRQGDKPVPVWYSVPITFALK